MKTTVDISDTLFQQLKHLAAAQATSMKELIETAVRMLLKSRHAARGTFRLRKHTFRGRGLHPDLHSSEWSTVRDRIYSGRGG